MACAAIVASGCAAARPEPASEPVPQFAATPRPFRLPTPATFRLANGLSLHVVERAHLPLVTVRVLVRAGQLHDEPALPGLARLTGALLKRGAGARSAPALAEAIDATGGSLGVEVGSDATTLTLEVLRRDIARGLGLLADVLVRPQLASAELDRLAAEQRAELEALLDDGDEVADLAIESATLAGHPYGRRPSRTALARIGRADVQRFRARWHRPARATVVVVGAIAPDEARSLVERALGGWRAAPGKPPVDPAPARPRQPDGPRILVVDMDVNQSYVRLGLPAPARAEEGREARLVTNFVLGDDFSSRLNMELRDRAGLAYGAYSRFEARREAGLFVARVNTRTETTRQAVDRLLTLLRQLREEPVPQDELDRARDHLAGAFPLRFETNTDVARELATLALHGLPFDEVASFRRRVRAIDGADVQAAARRWLPGDAWQLVVVGRASQVVPQLQGLGPIERAKRSALVE